MLKVRRPKLNPDLQKDLAKRQRDVDEKRAGKDPWEAFQTDEQKRREQQLPTVRDALRDTFHGKCGYCEASNGSQIDHHKPKSKHKSLNAGKGSPKHMFLWENFVWSCGDCNGRPVKGAHMQWEAGDVPRLLDPTAAGDDPLCYLSIVETDQPATKTRGEAKQGEVFPLDGLNPVALRRTEYTIRRLKLNVRTHLIDARRNTLHLFVTFESLLDKFDPDERAPGGPSIREHLLELLAPTHPHLAPIRQILRRDPERRKKLLERIPELGPLLDKWDAPPDDGTALRKPPAIRGR